MKDTIAILGSSRRHGNTGQLIDQIATKLDIEVVDLGQKKIAPYDYDHRHMDDDFLPLMEHVLNHERLIFASPEYWYSMSATMKIFIDRFSDFLERDDLADHGRRLRGKTAYIATTSISKQPDTAFIRAFTQTFGYLGMDYGGFIHIDCMDDFDAAASQPAIQAFIGKFTA